MARLQPLGIRMLLAVMAAWLTVFSRPIIADLPALTISLVLQFTSGRVLTASKIGLIAAGSALQQRGCDTFVRSARTHGFCSAGCFEWRYCAGRETAILWSAPSTGSLHRQGGLLRTEHTEQLARRLWGKASDLLFQQGRLFHKHRLKTLLSRVRATQIILLLLTSDCAGWFEQHWELRRLRGRQAPATDWAIYPDTATLEVLCGRVRICGPRFLQPPLRRSIYAGDRNEARQDSCVL